MAKGRRSKLYQYRKQVAQAKNDELRVLEQQLNQLGWTIVEVGKGNRVEYVGITGRIHSCEAHENWAVAYGGCYYTAIVRTPSLRVRWPFVSSYEGAIELAVKWSQGE